MIREGKIEVKADMRIMNGNYVMRFRWFVPGDKKRKEKTISTRLPATKANEIQAYQMLWDTRKEFEDELNLSYIPRSLDNTEFTIFMLRWVNSLKLAKSHEENTIQGYESKIRTYIIPHFKDKGLGIWEVTTTDLEEFYIKLLQEKKLSANTINQVHYCINNAYKDACRQEASRSGRWNHNPAAIAKHPAKDTSFTNETLTLDDWNKLREVFKGDIIEVPVMLAAYLGLSRSEVLGLRWNKINLKSKIVTVRNKVISIKGNATLEKKRLKRQSRYRKICMPDALYEVLVEWKQQQEENKELYQERYVHTIEGKENDFVCTWPDGRLIRPDYVTNHFREVMRKADIKTVRFHDLRHTIATLLNENGASLQDIKELLGHSSIITTSNIYIGFTEEIARKNAQRTQNLVCDG